MPEFGKNIVVFYVVVGVLLLAGFFALRSCGSHGTTGAGGTSPPPQTPTASPSAGQQADDLQLSSGGRQIVAAIEAFRAKNGRLPTVAEAAPNGALAAYLPDWPVDPYGGGPMKPGTATGDYTYVPSVDGTTYSLTIVYSTGPVKLQ